MRRYARIVYWSRMTGVVEEVRMKLAFLGEESGKSGCPSLYSTDRGAIVVQGWKITDAERCRARTTTCGNS